LCDRWVVLLFNGCKPVLLHSVSCSLVIS
jgi:hypothetical protein